MAKSKPSAPVSAPPVDAQAPPSPGYTVVARRYRPQQLTDLIGQEHVAQALKNAITSGRIAHAYLFTGPRGIGKTSTARILAKALNCTKGPTPTPCDQCDNCVGIISGDDVDVLEVDGASNNGVDQARELRNNVGFLPQHSRFKIYIIDEVHMLSTAAFNALLKTLEEPPAHVKFIFATTEIHKLPITILSRCQRFDFAAVTTQKVFATLRHIVSKEGLSADDEALQIIARRAGGSMRDAQTLLDQALGGANNQQITTSMVHEMLGSSEDERILQLAQAILSRDSKTALEVLHQATARGLQLPELLDQLIEYWRSLMLAQVAGVESLGMDLSPQWKQPITEQVKSVAIDTILAGLDILSATKSKLRFSAHSQVLVEVAVVRLARLEELVSITSLVQTLAQGVAVPLPANRPATPATEPSKKNSLASPTAPNPAVSAAPAGEKSDLIEQLWPKVLESLGPFLRTNLQQASSTAILGPKLLAIRFPSGYSAAYDVCSAEESKETLRKAIRKINGEEWQIRVEKVAGASAPVADVIASSGDRKKDLEKLPLFMRAKAKLNADIVKVQDGFNPVATPTVAAAAELPARDDDQADELLPRSSPEDIDDV
jgi:DNA polymerase III subunit gamma/tau